jgi:hypothetical protein
MILEDVADDVDDDKSEDGDRVTTVSLLTNAGDRPSCSTCGAKSIINLPTLSRTGES